MGIIGVPQKNSFIPAATASIFVLKRPLTDLTYCKISVKTMILINNRVTNAVADQDLHFFQSTECPFSRDTRHIF